ncbi:unnamed protein product [Cuscuta campestris]|uniref:MULE transposase domain-containing protein n=1 Tax=Cuscuta campestris TaxID=132261 RepID=A0A484KVC9_9ASTE|nr:unnamed protein product [Cuscuta campestris]
MWSFFTRDMNKIPTDLALAYSVVSYDVHVVTIMTQLEIVLHEKIEFDEGVCLVYAQLDEVTKTLRSAANIEGQSTYDSSLSMFEVDISCSIQDLVRDSATVSSQITLELQNFRTHVLDVLRNLISAPSAPPSLTHTVTMQHTDSLDQESEEEINVGLIPDVVLVLVANVVLSNDVDRDDSHRDQYLQELQHFRTGMLGAIKVLIDSPPSVPNLVSTIIDQNAEAHDHASKKEPSIDSQGGDDVDIRHEAINKDNGRSSIVEKKESVDKRDNTFQEFFTSAGVVIAEYDILKSVDKVTDGDGTQAHSLMLIETITLFELVDVVKTEHLISPRATTYVLRPASSFHHFAPRSKMVSGVVVWRYIVCNREGHKHFASTCNKPTHDDGDLPKAKQRRRISNRVDCKTRVAFRLTGGVGYSISIFIESRNHPMMSLPSRPFLKINRNLEIGHQRFMLNCAKANIGRMKSYQLFKESVGSYNNVGATAVDFKNFKRDLKAYIAGADAQMLIDKLFRKKQTCSAFHFDYDVDESDQLTRVFWCDPTAKKNYVMFGDVISFDATFNTNSLVLGVFLVVFTPFTGVDNHRRCVTFAAGLLRREDVPPHRWLFNRFLDAMGHAPQCIITDQDASRAIAIPEVFPNTVHRPKITSKVDNELAKDQDFLTRLNFVIWSHYLEPEEWEKQWNEDSRGMVVNVEHSTLEGSFFYTCKNWQRIGLLCCHIFLLFKVLKIKLIPERYITNRWCKTPLLKPRIDVSGLDFTSESAIDEKKVMLNRLWSNIHSCVALIENNPELLCAFSKVITEQKEVIESVVASEDVGTEQRDLFENYCGVPAPIQQ